MSNTIHKDDKEPKLETSAAEAAQPIGQKEGGEIQQAPLEAPRFGFNETGTHFVAEIDVRHGRFAVLGFFGIEIPNLVNTFYAEVAKKNRESGLLKPGEHKSGKGFMGRFNIFK